MNVENLNLKSPLFIVSIDDINIVYASSIQITHREGIFNIKVKGDTYEVGKDFDFIELKYSRQKVYLDLKKAQEYQEILRKNYIESLHEKLVDSLNTYNDSIAKYFNKPLSDPFKKEINKNE